MAATIFPISTIMNVSIAAVQTGAVAYSTSNIALFSDETPNLGTFGNLGYAVYLTPEQVGIDFGTSSKTYDMSNFLFSQQPGILTGNGKLIVILMATSVQTFTFSGVSASGTFEIQSSLGTTTPINWNDTLSVIQTKVSAVAGQEEWVVTGSIASQLLTVTASGTYGPLSLFLATANSLMTSAPAAVTILVASTSTGEKIQAAISRTISLVQYFGIAVVEPLDVIGQTDLLAAAAIVQPLLKMAFFVSRTAADLAPGGMLDLLRTGTLDHTRGLYYGDLVHPRAAIEEMAAYVGRGLSTNFGGSNTTSTMNLKVLQGVQPDPTLTQTQLSQAATCGADTYVSIQGVNAVISQGANSFFDQVYNRLAFAGDIQIAGFNYLATTSGKIPQTEQGMDGLKGACRLVCKQYVTNSYMAPGTWNGSIPFGDPAQFLLNISQFGFYIFSVPLSQQSQAARVARQAPLVQIAVKEAGAIHTGNIILFINP